MSYIRANLSHVRGHRQVTDAYLASLVADHEDSQLATFDGGLAHDRPDATVLVPLL